MARLLTCCYSTPVQQRGGSGATVPGSMAWVGRCEAFPSSGGHATAAQVRVPVSAPPQALGVRCTQREEAMMKVGCGSAPAAREHTALS